MFLADTETDFISKINILGKNIQNPALLKDHLEFQLKSDIVSFFVHVILRWQMLFDYLMAVCLWVHLFIFFVSA